MMPYRYPLVVLFSVTHCMACFTVSTWKYCFSSANVPPNMSSLSAAIFSLLRPWTAVQLTLLIISAGIVRGTLLVVLLQSVIPLRSLVLAVYDSSDNLMLHAISGTTGLVAIMLSFTPLVEEAFFKGVPDSGDVINAQIVFGMPSFFCQWYIVHGIGCLQRKF